MLKLACGDIIEFHYYVDTVKKYGFLMESDEGVCLVNKDKKNCFVLLIGAYSDGEKTL